MLNKLHLVIYTDSLPADVGGRTNACLVRIRSKYRNDAGIHAHEYEHVRQWWVGVLIGALAAFVLTFLPELSAWSSWWMFALIAGVALHPLAYMLLPSYRLWAEVRAYRIQACCYPDDRRRLFAGFIATRYGLMVSVEDVMTQLSA